MSIYEIITATIPIIAIIVTVFLSYRPQNIPVKLIRHDRAVKIPYESNIAIEISSPEKVIEKCRVSYKGQALMAGHKKTEITILAHGSAIFHIPIGKEDEEANIVVKNGRHTLRKKKLKDIEEGFKPWAGYIDW
jgi:hypothetical protein